MSKAAEEGEIWEWRAFGTIPPPLESQIKMYPFRIDQTGYPLANLIGQDLYLVSPASLHNIKLRKNIGGDWVLKFKLLLRTEGRAVELYHESEKKSFRFPVMPEVVRETAQLLNAALPQWGLADSALDAGRFLKAFAEATPPIWQVRVGKVRSQYQLADGWVELAEVHFPRAQTRSVSLHAFRRRAVEAMLDELLITDELEAMNYLEACRKWG